MKKDLKIGCTVMADGLELVLMSLQEVAGGLIAMELLWSFGEGWYLVLEL